MEMGVPRGFEEVHFLHPADKDTDPRVLDPLEGVRDVLVEGVILRRRTRPALSKVASS